MRTITIGRSENNDIVVKSEIVSGNHAELIIDSTENVLIRDKNSTNGTYVNGRRINEDIRLRPGDKVQLGTDYFDWEKAINEEPKTSINVNINHASQGSSITIGRSPKAQYRMPQEDVSSMHATLSRNPDGSITITDNNSTNGTFVNGMRISSQVLKPSDQVMIAGRYPLNWKTILAPTTPAGGGVPPLSTTKKKSNSTVLIAGIAIGVIVLGIVGFFGWKYYKNNRQLSAEEIYAKYKKTEVMIYNIDGYEASVGGTPLSEIDEMFNNISITYLDANKELQSGYRSVSGTGFFISDKGEIMTNKHVIDLAPDEKGDAQIIKEKLQQEIYSALPLTTEVANILNNLEVKHKVFYTGVALNDTHVSKREDFIPCTIVKLSDDEKLDLAIIQTNSKSTPTSVTDIVDFTKIASPNNMKVGNKIYTIGFPFADIIGGTDVGLEANNQSGEITQVRGEYEYGHNISIQQGASGSPVFDDHGKFAGVIVSGFLGAGPSYNQAINPEKAVEFAQKLK